MRFLDVPRYNALPGVLTLLDSIGSDDFVAKHLDVRVATVKAWRRAEQAPRAVMWALFWISSWGRDRIESDAANDARAMYSRMSMYQLENDKLKAQISRLEGMIVSGHREASNGPLLAHGGR